MALPHKGHVKTGKVAIKQRILQNDSLSPLLLSVALTPLTKRLNKHRAGYKIKGKNKISHIYYMDDLDIFQG
jgi:hypothetical protein